MFVGELAKLYARPKFKPSGGIEVTVDVWAENVITGEIQTGYLQFCRPSIQTKNFKLLRLLPLLNYYLIFPSYYFLRLV